MKRLIALLTWLLVPAAGLNAAPVEACRTNLIPFLMTHHGYRTTSVSPQKDCRYPLDGLMLIGKVKGGYLMILDPYRSSGRQSQSPVFLETKEDFGERARLTGWAVYNGERTYTSPVDGFDVTTFAFRFVK